MNRSTRQLLLAVSVLLVLVLSAIRAAPVYADDATPPPDASPTEVATQAAPTDSGGTAAPTDAATEAAPTEAPPTDLAPTDAPPVDASPTEAAPTEAIPVDAAVTDAAPTDAAPTEAAADPAASASDLLAQVPDGTDVVVVNAAGETVPLASQEAASIIATGDPMWCPVGVTPSLSSPPATCHNAATLQGLVNSFSPTVAGVIWITGQSLGTDNGGAVTIDGTGNWSAAAAFPLLLNGGWHGTGTTLYPGDTSLFSNSSISITGWGGTVTLNNITISDVTSGQALNIEITGNGSIVLNNVHVDKNTGAKGAKLQNWSVTGTHTGTVNVTNSTFNQNTGGDGLAIYSDKAVTLKDVDANMNGTTGLYLGDGAYIDNCNWDGVSKCLGSGAVTLTGLNTFSDNSFRGLFILSNGAISASNVVANTNDAGGAFLANCMPSGPTCPAANTAAITLTGANEFKFNGGDGLSVNSNGVITLNNITASDNLAGGMGAFLSNVSSTVVGGANITLAGVNVFNDNAGMGLYAHSLGLITISNLTADGNDGAYGAWIDNAAAAAPKAVTLNLTGTNLATDVSWNSNAGLLVLSRGAITISGLRASNNFGGRGAELDNCQALNPDDLTSCRGTGGITLSGWGSEFNGNAAAGLYAVTSGAITLSNITASSNGGIGAYLENDYGTLPVTISGYATFQDNKGYSGLNVFSRGAVTLNNVNADRNNTYGAFIDNCGFQLGVDHCAFPTPSPVTIANTPTFYPSFNNNGKDGLDIYSAGLVTLKDFDASGNGGQNFAAADADTPINDAIGFGVVIRNFNGTANVSVGTSRLNWCNSASNNFQSGLTIYSSGAVSVMNMCNGGNGGYQFQDVFNATGTGFDPDFDVGYGLYIDNTSGGTTKPVTLAGWNDFSGNFYSGLWIETSSAITASNLSANDNYGHTFDNSWGAWGAVLGMNWFSGAPRPQGVTLTGYGNFANNYYSGLEVYSLGSIAAANLDAHDNGQSGFGHGAFLDNCGWDPNLDTCSQTGVKPITLTGYNNFNANATAGFEAHSLGQVTISELHANDNAGFGARIDNRGWNGSVYLGTGGVTLTGNSDENKNVSGFGLEVLSRGAISITLNDMYTWGNGTWGWSLDNSASATAAPITLSTPNPDWCYDNGTNGTFGFQFLSRGNITIAGLDSNNQGTFGALLKNNFAGATGTITLAAPANGSNSFGGNGTYGLQVLSNRAISLGKVEANDNKSGYGAQIDNRGALVGELYTGSGNVTILTYGHFYNNAGFGLDVASKGAITLAMIEASDNLDYGARLDNTLGTLGITLTASGTGDPANRFNNNGWDRSVDPWVPYALGSNYGFLALSNGPITISNLRVRWNSNYGAKLDNCQYDPNPAVDACTGTGGVTLTGSWNGFTNNGGDGLTIHSTGAVAIANPGAWDNSGSGALIYNAFGSPLAPKNVTITGSGYFNHNGDDGIDIVSYGAILIANLGASDNGQNNFAHDLAAEPTDPDWGYGAWLANDLGTIPQPVTLTGANYFNGNYQDGLLVYASGQITVSKLTANWNGQSNTDGSYGDGAYLDNQWNGWVAGITLTALSPMDSNTFLGNGYNGLEAYSNGPITLASLRASSNGHDGAFMDTAGWTYGTIHTVTLSGLNMFEVNGSNGLEVWADGNITINNLIAEWNGGDGADLDNCLFDGLSCTGHGNITLTGVNNFRHNTATGLSVQSHGSFSATKLTADHNYEGVFASVDGSITLTCGSMVNNGWFGWELWAGGTVTLRGVTAFGNNGSLLYSDNPNTWLGSGTWVPTPRGCPLP